MQRNFIATEHVITVDSKDTLPQSAQAKEKKVDAIAGHILEVIAMARKEKESRQANQHHSMAKEVSEYTSMLMIRIFGGEAEDTISYMWTIFSTGPESFVEMIKYLQYLCVTTVKHVEQNFTKVEHACIPPVLVTSKRNRHSR